jgi:hypothetical protein
MFIANFSVVLTPEIAERFGSLTDCCVGSLRKFFSLSEKAGKVALLLAEKVLTKNMCVDSRPENTAFTRSIDLLIYYKSLW